VVQVHVHLYIVIFCDLGYSWAGIHVCVLDIRVHKINAYIETVSVRPSACFISVPNEKVPIIFDTESSRSNIAG
jgi:hypothetical protein